MDVSDTLVSTGLSPSLSLFFCFSVFSIFKKRKEKEAKTMFMFLCDVFTLYSVDV